MSRFAARIAGSVVGVLVAIAPYTTRADEAIEEETPAVDCPDALRGSTVSAKEIRYGVSLEFATASKALVPGLRRHVRDLEAYLSKHGNLADPAAQEPVRRIKVELHNTATGARVTLEASRAADIFDLRVLGEQFEDAWKESTCGPESSMPSSGRDLQT
jgi:hypothetical protein